MTKRFLHVAVAGAVAGAAVCVASNASAERIVTALPHYESFDANTYSELVWTSTGATHTWMPTAGWKGGAAKFTPPSVEGYSGLGQFMLNLPTVPPQLNLRFLILHGPTWREYGPGNKLVIMNRNGNRGRPMIITREFEPTNGGAPWETWAPCDGTVCKYFDGNFWPEGNDPLRIGNAPNAREQEWISVELEANTTTGMIKLYVDTLDAKLKGLYVERYMDDTGPGGTWAYIDIVGGYMAAALQAHPDNYFMIDELAIDSKYIGPPVGFGTTTPAQDGGAPDGGASPSGSGGPNASPSPTTPGANDGTSGNGPASSDGGCATTGSAHVTGIEGALAAIALAAIARRRAAQKRT